MYIIHVSIPDHTSKIYEPTRLIVGCGDQVHAITAMCQAAGIDVGEVQQTDSLPKRDQAELNRAERLLALLFMPAQGNA